MHTIIQLCVWMMLAIIYLTFLVIKKQGDFSHGPVVKNLPASAGGTGLTPSPGNSHRLKSSYAHRLQLVSLQSGAGLLQHEPPCS